MRVDLKKLIVLLLVMLYELTRECIQQGDQVTTFCLCKAPEVNRIRKILYLIITWKSSRSRPPIVQQRGHLRNGDDRVRCDCWRCPRRTFPQLWRHESLAAMNDLLLADAPALLPMRKRQMHGLVGTPAAAFVVGTGCGTYNQKRPPLQGINTIPNLKCAGVTVKIVANK